MTNVYKTETDISSAPTQYLLYLFSAYCFSLILTNTSVFFFAGILHSQRALAEVTEMIRTSNKLHKALLNYELTLEEQTSDVNFGNKIALLSGDYLLSNSFHELACLKNHDLNELMSSALRDLVECDFIGPRDAQNQPLPAKPLSMEERSEEVVIPPEFGVAPLKIDVCRVLGNAKAEWTLRNVLGGASLLGKSCQGTVLLAGHGEQLQKQAFLFGRHLALTWQAHLDLQHFLAGKFGAFPLTSAPVLFHLEHDLAAYEEIEKGKRDVASVDYGKLHEMVMHGPGIEKTKLLQEEIAEKAFEFLKHFHVKDAQEALENIIREMIKT